MLTRVRSLRRLTPLPGRVLAGFLCTLGVFIVIGLSATSSLEEIVATDRWISAAHRAAEQIHVLDAAVRAAESAQRGFVLTGSEDHLIAFNDAQSTAMSTLSHVGALSQLSPGRREMVEMLGQNLGHLLRTYTQVIQVRQNTSAVVAQVTMDGATTRLAAAQFQTLLNRLDAAESEEIATREAAVLALVARTRWFGSIGTLLACVLLIVGCVLVHGDMQTRAEASRRLGEYAQLETRNLQRVGRLAEFGQLLHSCQTYEEVYGVVGAAASTLFEAAGTVYRLRASADVFERVVTWGLAGPDSFPRDGCWAIRRGRPHVSGSGVRTPRCEHVDDTTERSRCIPLTSHGDTIGLLVLEDAAGEGKESDDALRLNSAGAEQLASALSNIGLRNSLRAQTIRDDLTGLCNRRFFEESLDRETRRAVRADRPLSLVMFDVDQFKRFNDTWGHEAGDMVLRELGGLVRTMFRSEDIGCRYGGEEFVLILADCGLELARERAEQLREAALQLRVRHRDCMLEPISLSLGIACTSQHGVTAAILTAAADQALYQAKRAGRNRAEIAQPAAPPAPVSYEVA